MSRAVDFVQTIEAADTKTQPLRRKLAPEGGSFETIIVGGGPAGMTAGVYLARKNIKTLMITPELGGQVITTPWIGNYPGYEYISGIDLAHRFREQLEEHDISIRLGDRVVSMTVGDISGTVATEQGSEYTFRTLLVASGKRSRTLEVPGVKKYKGRGLSYCVTCDAPLFKGQPVAVIGGGNSGFTAAIDLLNLGCEVHLIEIAPRLHADETLVERAIGSSGFTLYLGHELVCISGGESVERVMVRNIDMDDSFPLEVTGVFVEIGLIPNSSFAKGVLTLNDHDEIVVGCNCETNNPHIFAAGDVTNVPQKQIIIAAGEGAKAALRLSEYLNRHGRDW